MSKTSSKTAGPDCPLTPCSRIRVTLEISDPEVVADYMDTCDELVWEDLVNGELINFAEFVSRENANAHPPRTEDSDHE